MGWILLEVEMRSDGGEEYDFEAFQDVPQKFDGDDESDEDWS